jgi:hypothetical protein
MESKIPDEELPDEPGLISDGSKELGGGQKTSNETAIAASAADVIVPASPSSFSNILGLLSSSSNVTSDLSLQSAPEPPPPASLLGTFFGSATQVADTNQESVQNESDAAETGLGAFFTSLVTETAEPEAPVKTKLQELAEDLSSPVSRLGLKGWASGPKTEGKFDSTDAEDVVASIEKGSDPSKRVSRLLVVDQVESQLKLLEAKSAMRKLKELRKETNAVLRDTVLEDSRKKPAEIAQMPDTKKQENFDASNFDKVEEMVRSVSVQPVEPRIPLLPEKNLNEERMKRLEHYESIKNALAVIQSSKKKVSRIPISKQEKLRGKAKPLKGPHRAFHSFDPLHNASSSRIFEFPAETGRPLHPYKGIPNLLSPGFHGHGSASFKPSIVVTSVETRVIPRISHIF